MSEETIEGVAREAVGRVQDAIGGFVGSGKTQVKGKLNEALGSAQQAYGKAKDRALDALDDAGDLAHDAYDDVEHYVRDQPVQALAIGVGIGLALGLLLWGGRKIIYVRR